MRTFITFEFDEDTKNKIYEIQRLIKQNCTAGRFKYIDNFHLTVKFLGETSEETVDKIYEKMSDKLSNVKSFSIDLSGIGAFGHGEKVRTIYIKSQDETDSIHRVFNITDEIVTKYGFKRERNFSPHITIAQDVMLKIPFNELEKKLNYTFCRNIVFDKIVIMKSEQIANKRIYTPIRSIIFVNG